MSLDEALEVLLFQSILVDLYPLRLKELLVFIAFGATADHLAVSFEEEKGNPDALIVFKAIKLIWDTLEVKLFVRVQFDNVQTQDWLDQLINSLASVVAEPSLNLLPLNLLSSLPRHGQNDLSFLFLPTILRISILGLSLLLHLLHQLLK
jgi:hypothetical protein